jgi:hypothetical protein
MFACAAVVQGQGRPLLRPAALLCPEIHGETGLDGPAGGPVLPHCGREPVPGKAPLVMAEAIQEHHASSGQRVKWVPLLLGGGCSGAHVQQRQRGEGGSLLQQRHV